MSRWMSSIAFCIFAELSEDVLWTLLGLSPSGSLGLGIESVFVQIMVHILSISVCIAYVFACMANADVPKTNIKTGVEHAKCEFVTPWLKLLLM